MDALKLWAVAGLVTALLASGCSGPATSQARAQESAQATASQVGAQVRATQATATPAAGQPSGSTTEGSTSDGSASSAPVGTPTSGSTPPGDSQNPTAQGLESTPPPSAATPSTKAALRPSVSPVDRRTGAQRNRPFTVNGIAVVSAKHLVNGSFKPKVTGSYPLAPVAAKAFATMQKAIRKANLRLYVVSGYRSHASQAALYRQTLARMGRAHTVKYVAKPGSSEHQTGLALDLRSATGRGTTFDRTPGWRWLRAHAQDYGFVLRYPKGLTKVTGIAFEPWHWRYVGVQQATAIRALSANMTIEQYLRLA